MPFPWRGYSNPAYRGRIAVADGWGWRQMVAYPPSNAFCTRGTEHLGGIDPVLSSFPSLRIVMMSLRLMPLEEGERLNLAFTVGVEQRYPLTNASFGAQPNQVINIYVAEKKAQKLKQNMRRSATNRDWETGLGSVPRDCRHAGLSFCRNG